MSHVTDWVKGVTVEVTPTPDTASHPPPTQSHNPPDTASHDHTPLTTQVDQKEKEQSLFNAVNELVEDHAKVFGKNWELLKKTPVIGDLRKRIVQAIAKFGTDECKRAHRGHKKLCDTQPTRKPELRLCYMPLEVDGKNATNRLDPIRFQEFVAAGPVLKVGPTGPRRRSYWDRNTNEDVVEEFDGDRWQEIERKQP
jgi:hypothetical protein